MVLLVLRQVTVGHIAYHRLHVTAYHSPDISNIYWLLRYIYRYLLTFSTWILSLNFILVHYPLVLYQCHRGYSSLEVKSGTITLSFYIADTSVTLYTWLFLLHSSKHVIDQEESNTILHSQKEVQGKPDSMVVQRIFLSEYCWVGTTSPAEGKLLCCFV